MRPRDVSDGGAYATGVLCSSGVRIPHPGGTGLTLHAVDVAGLQRESLILDIGCGAGATVMLLRSHGLNAKGIDPSFTPAYGIADLYCQRATADNLPFPSQSFEAVLAECSLSVMEDPLRVLWECARVLRRGGKIILCDVYARNPEEIGAVRALGSHCISGVLVRGELEGWLRHCGFHVTCFEDHSQALRQAMAQFIFDHDSPAELWGTCESPNQVDCIALAMKRIRAGYFFLTAVRV